VYFIFKITRGALYYAAALRIYESFILSSTWVNLSRIENIWLISYSPM